MRRKSLAGCSWGNLYAGISSCRNRRENSCFNSLWRLRKYGNWEILFDEGYLIESNICTISAYVNLCVYLTIYNLIQSHNRCRHIVIFQEVLRFVALQKNCTNYVMDLRVTLRFQLNVNGG